MGLEKIVYGNSTKINIFAALQNGGLAQLARALAWHARGHRFDPDILHLIFKGFNDMLKPFLLMGYTVCTQLCRFVILLLPKLNWLRRVKIKFPGEV